ncbi:MAG TPA: hypothetical protein VF412_17940 [Bdellovibrio sp.]|uniref:hypothetical protein n=1 Tax=Bdellovibrio sp. TaxID=28201 RepID=UPI002F1C99E1
MNFKQAIVTIALTGIVAPAAHAVNMTNTSKTRGFWTTIYDRGQQATVGRADIVKIEVTSDPYCKQQTLCGTDTCSHSAPISVYRNQNDCYIDYTINHQGDGGYQKQSANCWLSWL